MRDANEFICATQNVHFSDLMISCVVRNNQHNVVTTMRTVKTYTQNVVVVTTVVKNYWRNSETTLFSALETGDKT